MPHVVGDRHRSLHGIDGLVALVAGFRPSAQRRLGVLVDHLLPGSKEERLARQVTGAHVLVARHPFVDIWAGIRPGVVGIDAWPEVPVGVPCNREPEPRSARHRLTNQVAS